MTETKDGFGSENPEQEEGNQDIDRDVRSIISYHERTKHRPGAFAAGPEFLDWDDQPDPFRRFSGSSRMILPLDEKQPDLPYGELFSGKPLSPATLDIAHVALFLEASLGLSAWKSYPGARWSLRINPSSGNLHPTEAYLVCPDIEGLPGGVYHYFSLDHALERRFSPSASWKDSWVSRGFLMGVTAIHWREAWKYGERAFRYCQHDAGHALAAIRLAAGSLGWQAVLLDGWSDDDVGSLLGVNRFSEFPPKEREAPEALVWVGPDLAYPESSAFLPLLEEGVWNGVASELSPDHRRWDVINEADGATRKGKTQRIGNVVLPFLPPLDPPRTEMPFGRIVRQRRSAQRFDPSSPALSSRDFFRMLDSLLPRPHVPPFDLLPWSPKIHPLFFVYRVDGIAPGCYILPRDPEKEVLLKKGLQEDFLWEKVKGSPDYLPLRALSMGDGRGLMQTICCRQAMASQCLFSVALLAEFAPCLSTGAHWYRWLHWEAGMVGQSLYLEAEAASVRGTGIGCFFDDEMHRFLGINGRDFQSLYHFTVGHPLDDPRLEASPPYGSG